MNATTAGAAPAGSDWRGTAGLPAAPPPLHRLQGQDTPVQQGEQDDRVMPVGFVQRPLLVFH